MLCLRVKRQSMRGHNSTLKLSGQMVLQHGNLSKIFQWRNLQNTLTKGTFCYNQHGNASLSNYKIPIPKPYPRNLSKLLINHIIFWIPVNQAARSKTALVFPVTTIPIYKKIPCDFWTKGVDTYYSCKEYLFYFHSQHKLTQSNQRWHLCGIHTLGELCFATLWIGWQM